jgi:hypothetical protein
VQQTEAQLAAGPLWQGHGSSRVRSVRRDHVRPRCAQRIRLLALGRRRYPASVTGLPTGAGDGTGEHLPAGAFHIPTDARLARFVGGAPPPGDARHRYVIVVQADSTPAWLGFSINLSGHLLGRAAGDANRVVRRGSDLPLMRMRESTRVHH